MYKVYVDGQLGLPFETEAAAKISAAQLFMRMKRNDQDTNTRTIAGCFTGAQAILNGEHVKKAGNV